jgi:Uma2 family endonuclease
MHMILAKAPAGKFVYPESDGQPMSDNTTQFRWIQVLVGNLESMFRTRDDVFVAGDLLWYPLEGVAKVRVAPDAMVVFDRPKGDRGAYAQAEENNIPVTVAFEIISPSNTPVEMDRKLDFYDEYGVEEYYVYNPEANYLAGFVRKGEVFRRVRPIQGHVSPRLGIRFALSDEELVIYRPDGKPFLTFDQLEAVRQEAEQRADTAERRAQRLAELTRKVLAGQLTPAEREELDRLLAP